MNSNEGRQYTFGNNLFDNPIEQHVLQKYNPDFLKESVKELHTIEAAIVEESHEKGMESSAIFAKRRNAIEEVGHIVEGIAQPLPQREDLEKEKYFFLSYSRRNEEEMRKLYLSLCAGGVISYFDNQETHTVLHKPALEGTPKTFRDLGDKKLVIGENYKEGLAKGVEENAYYMLLLTDDVIAKFDVIGGLEIKEAVDKKNTIIVAYSNEAVFEKLSTLEKENSEYKDAVSALRGGVKVLLNEEDFSKKPRELCAHIIDTVLEKESGTPHQYPKNMTIKREGINIQDTPLLETIEVLQENEESYGYQKRLEDCKSILMSETDTKSLITTGKVMNKAFVGYFDDVIGRFAPLEEALSGYGLQEKTMEEVSSAPIGKDTYVLLPVDEGLMDIEPVEFQRIFTAIDYHNPSLWVLPEGDFFSKISEYLKSHETVQKTNLVERTADSRPKPETPLELKLRFLRKLAEIQAIPTVGDDIAKNPQGFAKYLLKEQAMAESTNTFTGK